MIWFVQGDSENMLFERITASGVGFFVDNLSVTLMQNLLNGHFMITKFVIYELIFQVGLTIGSIGSNVVNNITFRYLYLPSFSHIAASLAPIFFRKL